ncbi:MAG: hypothetical protein AAFZ65_15690 [Planctomycetota bacterium]
MGLGSAWIAIDAHRDRSAWLADRIGQVAAVERRPVEAPQGVLGEAVRLVSTTGLTVELRLLRRPLAAGAPPRPAAVILGGHNTGRDAVELVGDPGDVVVAALDYPIDGNERIKGLIKVLQAVPQLRRALLDTPAAAALATRWLADEPGVDPERIELLGVSLGAAFAPVAAGLEPSVSRLWLIHGGADPREWLDHALRAKVAWPPLRRGASLAAYYLARGPQFQLDPWLTRLQPRELVVVAATDDSKLPTELVEAFMDGAPVPVRFAWTEGGHVDPDEPEIVRELIGTVLDGIAGEPPPIRPPR